MNISKEHILNVINRVFEQPEVKCKIVANALPSPNGEYWTAILMSTQVDTRDYEMFGKCEAPQGTHGSGNEQSLRGNSLTQVDEQHHSELVCHSTDKDALLGLCHHLLLDAIFALQSFSDSLILDKASITQNTYTVKG